MSYDPNDPEQVELVQKMLMLRADAARKAPADFLEFVMREQVSRKPIKCAPHQRVGLDFVMAHPRSVQMWPAGSSKTYMTVALTLFLLGRDPTTRGAIFSSIQAQAKKQVSVVSDYIGASADLGSQELKLVFPQLRRSSRRGDPWRDDAIVVERPAGIPDPSLVAVGIDGGALGSRLNWVIVDDILSRENTATADQRKKILEYFYSTILTRLDPVGGRVIVNNTAWHPDDLVHYLSDPKRGKWPSLKMTITGDIQIGDDPRKASRGEFWDHPLLRPKYEVGTDLSCRLVRPGVDDSKNDVPLFPERFFFLEWELEDGEKLPPARTMDLAIERARIDIDNKHHEFAVAGEFNRAFMNQPRDDASAFCKSEWIETCKAAARKIEHFSMIERYSGTNATFTGVDLAVSPGEESDDCAFFTFEVMDDRRRRILDIEVGKFDGPTIVRKLIEKHERYNSILRVENNACFPPGTRVLVRDRGYVPIEAVEPGDLVWTHRARWRAVVERLEGTSRLLSPVKVRGGLALRATPNHWFYLREAGRTPGRAGGHHRPVGEPQWVSAGFADRPAWAAVAVPRWPSSEPVLDLPKTRRTAQRRVLVGEDMALVIGLWAAEGHRSAGQVLWTFGRHERSMAEFVAETIRKVLPDRSVVIAERESTLRVIASSTALAKTFAEFGKSDRKALPFAWLGWPEHLRLAIVRGWLAGDGALLKNGGRRCFVASSVSRDLIGWMRLALLASGYRAALANAPAKTSFIEGRSITGKPSFVLRLPGDDALALRALMLRSFEAERWPAIPAGRGTSGGAVVFDGDHAWSRLERGPGEWHAHGGAVYNLVVDEDESFVAEDLVVHNAQDFIRQFALQLDKALPIKPHCTGRAKAHPEHGVPGLFAEMQNGAWLIPNDRHGNVHPSVQRWIDGCLYYVPAKHTDDILMASYFAREQAKQWGLLAPLPKRNQGGAAKADPASALVSGILSR